MAYEEVRLQLDVNGYVDPVPNVPGAHEAEREYEVVIG
jgi:hypothetical protein